MSRSKKKTPRLGFSSSETEKEDKRIINRSFRRKGKQQIKKGEEPIINKNEIMTAWDMAKDGKRYISGPASKLMRK